MDVVLLTIGKTHTEYIIAGIHDYQKRIRRYLNFSICEIPDVKTSKSMPENVQKTAEGELILKQLTSADYVVLLDERGTEYTSIEFSDFIQKIMSMGRKRLVFVVGGPYGFSEQVYRRCDAKLSLSRMTFNHEMVRLFFIEQIYRVMTIMRNEPYHHA